MVAEEQGLEIGRLARGLVRVEPPAGRRSRAMRPLRAPLLLHSVRIGDGARRHLARRPVGLPWIVQYENVRRLSERLGYNLNECHVCPEHKGRRWDSVRQHARGKEHQANVGKAIARIVSFIGKLTIGKPADLAVRLARQARDTGGSHELVELR